MSIAVERKCNGLEGVIQRCTPLPSIIRFVIYEFVLLNLSIKGLSTLVREKPGFRVRVCGVGQELQAIKCRSGRCDHGASTKPF